MNVGRVKLNEIQKIETIIYPSYHGQRFGLIANRVNHYSVNPLAINKLFSGNNLVAGVIVGHSKVTRSNAEIENEIVKEAPIEFFLSMRPAIKWIDSMIENNSGTKEIT